MISGWRIERRIGPATLSEKAWSWSWWPLLLIGSAVLGGTLILLIKLAFGDVSTLRAGVIAWSAGCIAVALTNFINGALQGRWLQALAALVTSSLLTFAVLKFAIPILYALGWAHPVLVPPVTP